MSDVMFFYQKGAPSKILFSFVAGTFILQEQNLRLPLFIASLTIWERFLSQTRGNTTPFSWRMGTLLFFPENDSFLPWLHLSSVFIGGWISSGERRNDVKILFFPLFKQGGPPNPRVKSPFRGHIFDGCIAVAVNDGRSPLKLGASILRNPSEEKDLFPLFQEMS